VFPFYINIVLLENEVRFLKIDPTTSLAIIKHFHRGLECLHLPSWSKPSRPCYSYGVASVIDLTRL